MGLAFRFSDRLLQAAIAYGLFEGEHGKDLKSRLIGVDNTNFRSAISECLVCWLLSGMFSLPVRPKPPGRERKTLKLLVDLPDGDIRVEVKAPYPVNPYHPTSVEDPLKRAEQFNAGIQKVLSLLTRCLKKANNQFEENVRNVLFLTFFEDARLYWPRDLMTRAFFGEEKETYSVDTQMNPPRVKAAIRWFPTGQLLHPNYPKPYFPPYKQTPHFTRVSAVVLVQERFKLATFFPEICHDVWILHNPHAEHSVPPKLWGKYPQLLKEDDGVMRWTDGYDSWKEEDQRWDGHTDDPPHEYANPHYRIQNAGKGGIGEWTPFTVQAVAESLDIEGR